MIHDRPRPIGSRPTKQLPRRFTSNGVGSGAREHLPPGLRSAVLILATVACGWLLISGAIARTAVSAAAVGAPKATPATFAGTWIGHTRLLKITRTGYAKEHINAGCCDPVLDLWFRLSHVHGTTLHASVTVRVTKVHVLDPSAYAPGYGPPHAGETRILRLNNGVIREPLTQTSYCDSTAETTGACGA